MANRVVLGDLSKYNANSCLRFYGVNDYVNFGNDASLQISTSDLRVKVTFEKLKPSGALFENPIIGKYDGGSVGWYLACAGTGLLWRPYGSGAIATVTNFSDGMEHTVEIVQIGGNATITIDDDEVINISGCYENTSITENAKLASILTYYTSVCVRKADIGTSTTSISSYDLSNAFGSPDVPDLTGGNDGTINGATWWKQGVDENFSTPQLYKSSWGIPMVEDQEVIYTDATPYYKTDDVFWNDYNIDLTYTFIVTRQSDTYISNESYSFGSLQFKLGLYL